LESIGNQGVLCARTDSCSDTPIFDRGDPAAHRITADWDRGLSWMAHPDSLGTVDLFRVGDERLGLELFRRLLAPSELAGLESERILVGHGEPVTVEPGAALRDTRRRAPDVPESTPRERPGEPPDDRGGPP
jgi:hypothetical protein